MAHVPPDQPRYASGDPEEGRAAAGVVWLLYLLTGPSGGLTAVIGVIVAYAVRGTTSGWVLGHLNDQIKLFWSTLVWMILLGLFWLVSLIFTAIIIGLPFLIAATIAIVVLFIWAMVKSVLGLIGVVQGRAP